MHLFLTSLLLTLLSCATTTAPEATHYKTYPRTAAGTGDGKLVDFYSRSQPYGEFSNFALFPVFVDGQWWPTSEHYYQAMKYDSKDLIEWVRTAPDPMTAANRGRDKNVPKRTDWEQVKDVAMEKAVKDKFTRYPELRALLLSTGEARLYEHTENDCYWGDCGNRTGQNKLGLLLEKIRRDLAQGHP
jgi:ribA/ribD-fused uncharacterized protein